jgi:hypothetical protein
MTNNLISILMLFQIFQQQNRGGYYSYGQSKKSSTKSKEMAELLTVKIKSLCDMP